MSAEVVDDLARARAAFDSWRAGRSGAGRIPEHLWALAETLVDHHSPQAVARELGLNPARMRALEFGQFAQAAAAARSEFSVIVKPKGSSSSG